MAKYDFSDFDKPKEEVKSSKKNLDFSDFSSSAPKQSLLESLISKAQEYQSPLNSLEKGVEQGASLGFGDEYKGVSKTLTSDLPSEIPDVVKNALLVAQAGPLVGGKLADLATGKTSLSDIKNQYLKNRDDARQEYKQAHDENPMLYTGGELAGGFVLPGMGAAKGIGSAVKAGAVAGGLGSLGNAEELTPDSALEAGKAAATGAAVGGTLGYAGSKLADFMGHITGSATGQVAKKAFSAGRAGQDIVGPEAAQSINNAMRGESSDLVNKTIQKFKQAQEQYGKMIDGVKLDNPQDTAKALNTFISNNIENSTNASSLNGVKQKLQDLIKNSGEVDLRTIREEYLAPIESQLTAVYGGNVGRAKATQIEGLIFNNNPELQNIQNAADAMYKPAATAMESLGIKTGDFSKAQIKNEKAIDNLVQKSKISAQAPGNDADNTMERIKGFVGDNENFQNLENLGQNFKLNRTMTEGGVKGKITSGAYELGKVSSEATDNALTQALSKLPGASALAGHIKSVMSMEPNAKNRAIFTLSQQPWFRELTKSPDDNK
jgi:hypothetical protein